MSQAVELKAMQAVSRRRVQSPQECEPGTGPAVEPRAPSRAQGGLWMLAAVVAALALVQILIYPPSEPFFDKDETRHVMTGVFFRDLLHDLPFSHLQQYATNYYLQYPAIAILVWPPLFYFLEGVAMSLFGMSVAVARGLLGAFAALAGFYLFLIVRRSSGPVKAALTVLLFGLTPAMLTFSHYVMLEVPMLALALGATYHFLEYVDGERRRDLYLTGLFSALAALTRFDAVYLLVFFALMLTVRKRWELAKKWEVIAAAAGSAALVAPAYLLTLRYVGGLHLRQLTERLSPDYPQFWSLARFAYYPSSLVTQIGIFAVLAALVGLAGAVVARPRAAVPYVAWFAAVYLTFTPMGEVESRHATYWIPAFLFFAVEGIYMLAGWARQRALIPALLLLVLAGTAWRSLAPPRYYLRGYEEAAAFIAADHSASLYCLFVGYLDGNFIYQARLHDPDRRRWVLRADRLFAAFAGNERSPSPAPLDEALILATLYDYGPEFVVIEERRRVVPPLELQIRGVVTRHPERFRLERTIAVDTNDDWMRETRLLIFRNTLRNPTPRRRLDLQIPALSLDVHGAVP